MPRRHVKPIVVSRTAGVAVSLLAIAVLVGWLLDVDTLKHAAHGLPAMMPQTALALLVAGVGLALCTSSTSRVARRAGALGGALAALVGVEMIVELAFDFELIPVAGPQKSAGPVTATALILVGAAVALANAKGARVRGVSRVAARVVAMICLIRALAYVYGADETFGLEVLHGSMAVHTVAGLFALAVGVILMRADEGVATAVRSKTLAGLFARRLLPAVILVPAVLGFVVLEGERAGLYGTPLGIALFAVGNMVALGAVAWVTTRALLRFENAKDKALNELIESERWLRTTLRSIGDGVIATDGSGRVVKMNPVAEALTGWREQDALARPLDDVFGIINEHTRQKVESPTERVLRQGVKVGRTNHTLLVAKDGTERAIADSGAPIKDDDGVIQGVVMVFRDVTNEKKAEQLLRTSEARFGRLRDSGMLGIVIAHERGAKLEANDAFLKMVGYTREDMLAGEMTGATLDAPENAASNVARREELYAAGVSRVFEQDLVRKDGSRVRVLTGAAMLDASSSIAIALDLTTLKQAEAGRAVAEAALDRSEEALRASEQQLRHSQKMEAVGELAGGIAHDFNNLLTIILAYSEMIADDLKDDDPLKGEILEIKKAGERASGLTRQLLAFSRRQVLSPRTVSCNAVVAALLKMLGRLIGENIELTFVPTEPLGEIHVDPTQLEQVLMNLVVNARDAMPDGGKLTITTENVDVDAGHAREHFDISVGPHVMLSVTDTGCGMDRATQARIFEPFFTTKGAGKGTGLGLSVVFGVVKQRGGTIWVYSEPGKGTTFKVYFPRANALSVTTPSDAPRGAAVGGHETVLLVEDEEAVRQIARRVLTRAGYTVLDAANGGEGLMLAEQHTGDIALLLTDVVMPKMSGRDLAVRLQKIRPAMKTVYMSGYTDDAVIRHGVLEAGVSFLQKPLLPDVLLRKVREALGP